jgi:hypothetical protein
MAFERRRRPGLLRAGSLRLGPLLALPLLEVLGLACGGSERRFPLRDPLWQDTDGRPVYIDCEERPTEKEPHHESCAPVPYVSPLVWDGLDNAVLRPFARVFKVDPAGPAPNVNAFDEVPDSAWFTNRLGLRRPSPRELLQGACSVDDLLDGETAPAGSWVIDQGKPNGASPGFRIKVADKLRFLLKTDSKDQPERPTAASAIGAAIYHAVGFNTSCEQIVNFDPKVFTLLPNLVVTDNTGIPKPFNDKALDKVLSQAERRGTLLRMQASAWLPGYLLGPFRYEGTRSDDPNDVIPHEDRRELRGARVLAAWINHFDAREQNTMDTWISSDPSSRDGSPGYVRHYYLDTSDSFGSEWDWDGISRRLGHSYLLDWGDIGADFITLGIPTRPWELEQKSAGYELFGYFNYHHFDPAGWKNEYPNPAFSRATEHDDAWMARILSRFEREDIERLVTLGKFSHAEHSAFLTNVLEHRLQRILLRYLSLLSPLSEPRVESNELCLVDLARRRGVAPAPSFRYQAVLLRGGQVRPLEVEARRGGDVCLRVPNTSPDAGPPPGDASRYGEVLIANGFARYPLAVHFYDQGSKLGLRVVGLERPEASLEDAAAQ